MSPARAAGSDKAVVAAAAALRDASEIALACHVGPDGDALGSTLGLFHVLRAAGRPVVASFPDPFVAGPTFTGLPGLEDLVPPDKFPAAPEVMVTFDCGSLDRLGNLEPAARAASELIVVDHHLSNDSYGTINLIEPDAAASASVVLKLIDELGLELNRDAAFCLYVALISDTGRFQYENTTPAVFEMARRLTEFDLPVADLSRQLFEVDSFAYLRLLGEVLNGVELDSEFNLIWAVATNEMYERHGVKREEAEGLIDIVRRAAESEVALLLYEEPDSTTRGSLRSLGGVDVLAIAQTFGGGGHRLAAGFSSDKPPLEVLALVRSELGAVGGKNG